MIMEESIKKIIWDNDIEIFRKLLNLAIGITLKVIEIYIKELKD